MNPKLLEVIACPSCLARLQYDAENQQFICRYEHLAYPIENGIPILLAEKAEKITD
ncbi:Trm112 family protein [Rodentibacter sp. Ppn85]|uniref:Trm112 family protein n=1 Tax=Rodentibacter sp. Ppn85 TaxID=1908525 RepID=UPI0018E9381A|nr:Trm112 family protein [Rodentibacter sp. Ppn85]